MDRSRIIAGLTIAFAALLLAPLLEVGLAGFAVLAQAVLVVLGLAVIWKALDVDRPGRNG